MEMKAYKNKKKLLQIMLLALFVLLIFVMIFYIEHTVNQSMEKEKLITLETVSGKVTSSMTEYFEQQWNHLSCIEEMIKHEQYETKDELFCTLEYLKKSHGLEQMNSLLILIDEKGYYHTIDAGKVALWRNLSGLIGNMVDGRVLTRMDLAEAKGQLKQYICFMKKLDEPVRTADGGCFPYVVLATDEQVFEIDLTMGEFGVLSDAFVINSNGRKISSQMKTLSFARSYNILSALKNAEFKLGDSYEKMESQIRNGESGSSLVRYKGKEYFIAHHFMEIEDWSVVFIADRNQIADRITPFIYSLLVSLSIGFCGLFLLALGVIVINRNMELQRERQLNRQLKEAMDTAERANKAKSEFLSRMSHDIRTPLNGIIGMTAIAEQTLDDRKSVESCLKKITSSSDHLLELINEVLDIARIENGKVEVKNAPFNLKEQMQLLDDINVSRVAAKSLIYRSDVSRLRHTYVISDKTILNQILLNIIGNAVKYTEDNGRVCFTVYDTLLDEDTAEYHFIVADTGIGMTPEYVEHIFESFSQEEIGVRTKYEGTGLGMAITKQLVDILGGSITVQSEKNVGSTFEVILRLPICQKEQIREEEIRQKEIVVERNYHLLLAEDNEMNREIAEFMLEDAGISCRSVEDGVQAVRAFEESAPGEYDAILLDILMPNMGGHEAARTIRAMERPDAETIPIFAMTAGAYEEDRKQSFAAGMNEHLTKPVVMNDILQALQKWCDKE